MKIPAAILALIAILAAGYVARGWFRSYIVSMTTDKAPACLEVLGHTTSEEEGRTYIIGSIRNHCQRSFGHVTILFKLNRAPGASDGLPEGVAYAYGNDVKGGEVRKFKTALPVSRNAIYRFDGINAY
jgi:hypothetical protein